MRTHWLLPDEPFESYAAWLEACGGSAVSVARAKARSAVLRLVQHSHLRGRGGAGFPTGTKWASLASHKCKTRYVVCNAAEGEPGTFKDRYLIRRNPYAVVEGLLIAAHVIESDDVIIAVKASFQPEIERLEQAIREMADVIGGVRVRIFSGPEAYLYGEEKALLNAIEGEGPLPREAHRPPYEFGLFATPGSPNPALVNNAETYAHVPSIVRDGPTSFLQLGTSDTPGTVLFTISGDVKKPGVYECEAGVTVRSLLYDVAGGPLDGRELVAVLPGVSTGPITADRFDTPADFGSLSMIGSGLGSAGFVVLDDSRSMASVARAAMRFLYVESCNQCSACKQGLRVASTALDDMFENPDDNAERLERARHAARRAPQGNRCYLPVQGSTVMSRFADTYADHFAAAGPGVAPYELPKLTDLDASAGFSIDPRQALKRPDWSYDDVEPPATPEAAPADVPHPDTVVALPADIVREVRKIADADGTDVEQVLARALREWLANGGAAAS